MQARAPLAPDRTERLLTLAYRHEDVLVVEELVERIASDLAAELDATVAIRRPEEPVEPPAPTTVPLVVRGELVGYLDVAASPPLGPVEERLLGHLARGLGHRLTHLSALGQLQVLEELTAALAAADGIEDGVRPALATVLRYTAVDAARLLVHRDGAFATLGEVGRWPEGVGPDGPVGLARAALSGREAVSRDEEWVAARLAGGPPRYVLVARIRTDLRLPGRLLPGLLGGARAATPHVEALWRKAARTCIHALDSGAWDAPPEGMYERLLDTAIRFVHGAQAGSLLVRRGPGEPFVYEAARGFDDLRLVGTTLTEAELRAWYGADEAGWRAGRSRVLRDDDADIADLSRRASGRLAARGNGADRIRANLCLPVPRGGEIVAILNLDLLRRDDAFGDDSRAVAELFAPPLANILHRHRNLELLRRAALTDPLTGLDNRRPISAALQRELARQRRTGEPVSVLVMDLRGFKAINDGAGHEAGDEALVRVAAALRDQVRDVDLVGRWGGDEFAAVLVGATAPEAAEVAERLGDAVARIDFGPGRLAIDVGTATAPADGVEETTLVAAADARMYAAKRRARAAG